MKVVMTAGNIRAAVYKFPHVYIPTIIRKHDDEKNIRDFKEEARYAIFSVEREIAAPRAVTTSSERGKDLFLRICILPLYRNSTL